MLINPKNFYLNSQIRVQKLPKRPPDQPRTSNNSPENDFDPFCDVGGAHQPMGGDHWVKWPENNIEPIFGPFCKVGGAHLNWAAPTTVHWAEPNCSLGGPHFGFWPVFAFFRLFVARVLVYFGLLTLFF